MRQINEKALTESVGQFISAVRNGKKPSMVRILKEHGINSSVRAKQLIDRMIEHRIICKYSDGSYHLTQLNYDSKVVMNLLLRKENNKKLGNPLSRFTPQQLVLELRNRGYDVVATREIKTIETL